MPTGNPWYTNIGESLGKFAQSDAFPVYAGGLAQAMMAPYPNDPKAQIIGGAGGLGAVMGQSNIAAKAAKRQADERAMMNKLLVNLLAGKGLTEAGVPGPTSANITTNPDGTQKVTVTGDGLFGGWEDASRGGMKAPVAPAPPPSAAMTRGSGFLPFYLGLSGSSSGGAGQNLFGLTPEQIASVTTQDIQGGQLGNIRAATLFDNLQRQAMADYYNRQPNVLKAGEMQVNDKTGNWSYYDLDTRRMIDTGIKASARPISEPNLKPTVQVEDFVDPRTGKRLRRQIITRPDGSISYGDWGLSPEASPETGRQWEVTKDLSEIEARIRSGKDVVRSDVDTFNKTSESDYVYIPSKEKTWYGGTKEGFTAKSIPQIPGRPKIRAKDVYDMAKVRSVDIDDILYTLELEAAKGREGLSF